MKKIIFFLLLGASMSAQSEFNEFENNLIYSSEAISRLQEIVGDKNEEFRKCDLTKDFVSIPQAKGFCFNIKGHSYQKIRSDLKDGISLENFSKKYAPNSKVQLSLITKTEYTNYNNQEIISITEEPNLNSIKIKDWETSNFGNWIITKGWKHVKIFYIQDMFKTAKLPYKYSRMIQYAECLIDSTTQIHSENATSYRGGYSKSETLEKRKAFYNYVNKKFKVEKPILDKKIAKIDNYKKKVSSEGYKKFRKDLKNWKNLRSNFLRDSLSKREHFRELLLEAHEEALKENNSDNKFEEYIATYLSKEKALDLKRNRIVVGSCSMDRSPRIHAMNIAQLSAESYQWDVFLRAHLNIMNDRFQRATDGSYAWKNRNTYIKELEVLNIDVASLVYGISLRVDNPSKNHYFGSIRRVGRAIAESKDKQEIKSQLIEMIKDSSLDDYNRMLAFYLYQNLQYSLDKDYDKNSIKPIKDLLPTYLSSKV